MTVVINEFEVAPPPAEQSAPAPPPAPARPPVDLPQEVRKAAAHIAERLLRVRAD